MKLDEAKAIAERVKAQLAPHCERIEIAGSIRRKKPDVGDIEIVAIPTAMRNLFGGASGERPAEFAQACYEVGERVKGDPSTGRYIQLKTPEGIMVDLFLAHPDNWGLIFAIRTGSADYSHRVLARGWVRNGYKSADGMLTLEGAAVPVREECELFRLAGVPWVEPEARSFIALLFPPMSIPRNPMPTKPL